MKAKLSLTLLLSLAIGAGFSTLASPVDIEIPAPAVLAEKAKGLSSSRFRMVQLLTDEAFLVDVIKNAADWEVRQMAVQRLTNQVLLARIAIEEMAMDIEGKSEEDAAKMQWSEKMVRDTATMRLKDQALLVEVAKNCPDEDIRGTAVGLLSDQTIIADFAKNDKATIVRKRAIEKLNDQTLLTKIEGNDEEDSEVRSKARERLYWLQRMQKVNKDSEH